MSVLRQTLWWGAQSVEPHPAPSSSPVDVGGLSFDEMKVLVIHVVHGLFPGVKQSKNHKK